MKRTTLVITIAALTCFLGGTAQADSSSASSIAGGSTPTPDRIPQDKRTDLTGGQQGVPDEYASDPVAQGRLKEVKDSKWLNQPVYNRQGEKLGIIKKMLKDDKSHDVDYVFFEVADSRYARPMRWSQFEQKGDKLTLNMTKEQLLPPVNRTEVKDMSPDLAFYMDEIEKRREEGGMSSGNERPSGDPGSLSGAATMGEDQVGTHRKAPPTPAPQFEHDGAKKK